MKYEHAAGWQKEVRNGRTDSLRIFPSLRRGWLSQRSFTKRANKAGLELRDTATNRVLQIKLTTHLNGPYNLCNINIHTIHIFITTHGLQDLGFRVYIALLLPPSSVLPPLLLFSSSPSFLSFFFLSSGFFCVIQTGLNLWSSCHRLPSAGITGVCHQAWLQVLAHAAHFAHFFSDLLNLLKQTPPNIPPSSSATHSLGSLLGLQGCWPSFIHHSSALGWLLDYSLGWGVSSTMHGQFCTSYGHIQRKMS